MNNHPRRWPAPHKDQRQDRRLEQNKMRRPKQLHSSRTQSEPGAAKRDGANENRNVRRKCFLPRGVQRALAILTRKISVVLVLSRLNSFAQTESWDLSQDRHDRSPPVCSAVTLFAIFPGLSTSSPRARKKMSRAGPPATWYSTAGPVVFHHVPAVFRCQLVCPKMQDSNIKLAYKGDSVMTHPCDMQ